MKMSDDPVVKQPGTSMNGPPYIMWPVVDDVPHPATPLTDRVRERFISSDTLVSTTIILADVIVPLT